MSTQKKFVRLPTSVKPMVYDLSLKVDLKNFMFSGEETIIVEVRQTVNRIVLNSKDLTVSNSRLTFNDTRDCVLIPEICLAEDEETLSLQFSDEIPAGEARIIIEFSGVLNDSLVGFYRSKYNTPYGEDENFCAVTQFAATDARRCFPCWDEPAIKACFDITLEVDSTKVALSNMPIESETPLEDGRKRVKFARTSLMSTYLVAFIVGDFEYVEDTTSDGVLVRVYAPTGKKDQGKFALEVAIKALSYLQEYFQVAYPLPKIDLVAVAQMTYGAMENWGLITYRESRVLVDKINTSASTKEQVALTVSHELAHQWFGNLVTLEWWTHLWLNEGYASFVESLCVDHLFPDYHIWTQFVSRRHCSALDLDALKNSHPVEVPVGHPFEIDEIFDAISYSKGASVIRMLYNYIKEKDFKKGMNLYLTRHQYGNASTEDLWAALEEASGKPVQAVMSTWTKQVGFPVITVEESIQNGDDSRTLVLSQSKFGSNNAKDGGMLWSIPISFCSKSRPDAEFSCTMMDSRRHEVILQNVKVQDWLKLNQNTVGFYRVKYPQTLLQQFLPSIRDKSLPPLDRLNVLDDLFALVQHGQASTVQVLDLIYAMKDEDNYTVWTNILTCLKKIHSILTNTDYLELFNAYAVEIVRTIYTELGLEKKENEPHLSTLLRNIVLASMVTFGATDFEDIVREKFRKHCRGTDIIPADQRNVVYRSVLASDGRKAFDELRKLYRLSDLEEEKDRILIAFSAAADADLVDDILEFAQSNDLTAASTVTALISIAYSKVGREKTFNIIRNRYDELHEMYTGGGSLFPALIKSITENFASEEQANDIESFFATKNTSGAERAIQQALEMIRKNAAWLCRDGEQIKRYLVNLKH